MLEEFFFFYYVCPKYFFFSPPIFPFFLGGRKVSKHVELWAKNAFDELRQFRGFDITKLIVDLSKDEGLVKNLVDMLSTFVLQVVEKR
jgi:hypothetical protein